MVLVRTPPRKRHRAKSSQSPRSSRSSSANLKPEQKLQAFLDKQKHVKNDKLKNNKEVAKTGAAEPRRSALRITKTGQDHKESKDKAGDEDRKKKAEKTEKKEQPEAEEPKKKKEKKDKKDKPEDEDRKRKAEKTEKKEQPEAADPKKKKEKKEKKDKPEDEDRKKKAEKTEKKEQPEAEEPKKKKEKKDKKDKPEDEDRKRKKEKLEDEDAKKETEKTEKKGKDGKKEEKITYVPCQREKISPIFKTPPVKKRPPSTTSSQGMTSKEKAEAHLESLKNIMADSEEDSLSALDETDLDNLVQEMQEMEGEEEEEKESDTEEEAEDPKDDVEESTSEDEKEEKKEKVEKEEKKEKDEEDEEDEDSNGLESEESEAEEDQISEYETESEEAEEKREAKEKQDKNSHVLVPVTAATTTTVAVLKNSTSDKKAWDSFTRQLKGKAPIAISEYAVTHANKLELFNMWMDSGKSWDKCEVLLERKMEKKNEGTKGWQAIQGKVLAEQLQHDKWIKIRDSRKASGMWYPDDDFPDDDLEPSFNFDNRWFGCIALNLRGKR